MRLTSQPNSLTKRILTEAFYRSGIPQKRERVRCDQLAWLLAMPLRFSFLVSLFLSRNVHRLSPIHCCIFKKNGYKHNISQGLQIFVYVSLRIFNRLKWYSKKMHRTTMYFPTERQSWLLISHKYRRTTCSFASGNLI